MSLNVLLMKPCLLIPDPCSLIPTSEGGNR
jgi:hypothetical protein